MATVSAQRLAEVFVEVADTLVDEFDLIEFLHLLTVPGRGSTRARRVTWWESRTTAMARH